MQTGCRSAKAARPVARKPIVMEVKLRRIMEIGRKVLMRMGGSAAPRHDDLAHVRRKHREVIRICRRAAAETPGGRAREKDTSHCDRCATSHAGDLRSSAGESDPLHVLEVRSLLALPAVRM